MSPADPPDLDRFLASARTVGLSAVQPPTGLLDRLHELPYVGNPTGDGETVPASVGPYRVVRVRGRGGMGVVYEAIDPHLGRRVAVKVLPGGEFADPKARDRFAHEARTAAGLRHDHLVPVYAAETPADAPPYLVMPFIDGPTLADLIAAGRGLPARTAAEYARQVADGLAAAHAAGIVHRDVKPGNVLIDGADGRAKLADFGLARPPATPSTTDGVAGTPGYLSPEQVHTPDAVDARADVYGLGATLYECLTGVPPFRGPVLDVLRMIAGDDPVPPRRLNRDAPRDLETVCLKCLEKDPADRYPSAAALRDDLARWLADRPVLARPVGRPAAAWRWCRRNPVVAGLTAALVVALVGGLATAAVLWRQAEVAASAARAGQQEAESAALREQAARELAEDHLRTAREVVDRFCTRVSEEELLQLPGMEPVRRKLLADAVEHYRRFVAARRGDPAARRDVAAALGRLTKVCLDLGAWNDAVAAAAEALALDETLLAEQPGDADRRASVAADLYDLSVAQGRARDFPAAGAAGTRAADCYAALAADYPAVPAYRRGQADALTQTGLARAGRGDGVGGVAGCRAAVALLERLVRDDPSDWRSKAALAGALSAQATIRMGAEDIPTLERCRGLRAELAKVRPDSAAARYALAETDLNLGVLYRWSGRTADAAAAYGAAADILGRLVADHPRVVAWRRNLGRTQYNLAQVHRAAGRTAHATAALRQAADHFELLLRDSPGDANLLQESVHALAELADLLADAGDRPAAAALLTTAGARVDALARASDLPPIVRRRAQLAARQYAEAEWRAGDRARALAAVRGPVTALLPRREQSAEADGFVKGFVRWRAEFARAAGSAEVLAAVDAWAETYTDSGDELAAAARAAAETGTGEELAAKARELFTRARERGWRPPPEWVTDPRLGPLADGRPFRHKSSTSGSDAKDQK